MIPTNLVRFASGGPQSPATPLAPVTRRYKCFDELQDAIDRAFDECTGFATTSTNKSFLPHMDVSETDDVIRIAVELPGVDEKDIDVRLADGMLTVSGEKRLLAERKTDNRLVERRYGAFSRSVAVPAGIDPSRVRTSLEWGVLTIEAPKPVPARPQRVAIEAR